VKILVFCSNCVSKIDEEAYFCPKCGTKNLKDKAAKATYPADEVRDAFCQAGLEFEKAIKIAAKETHAALRKASENLQNKTTSNVSSQNIIACPKCGTKNILGSIFCYNCGSRIVNSSEEHGSV
jgi:uncharacterized membrane protein YvbJ